jgi:hypothetical protein
MFVNFTDIAIFSHPFLSHPDFVQMLMSFLPLCTTANACKVEETAKKDHY